MENPKQNAPRALFISYTLVLIISILYQLLFYTAIGPQLAQQSDYLNAFPLLFNKLFSYSPLAAHNVTGFLHFSVALSALGGSYAVLFSNFWNLHILAKNNHLPGSFWLLQQNKYSIPFRCVAAEGFIALFYLIGTQGNQIALQQTAALGCSVAYSLSVLSLLNARISHKTNISLGTILLGLFNCVILIFSCMFNFILFGFKPFLNFMILFILGIFLFGFKQIEKMRKTKLKISNNIKE